uniref:Uncharacterized protein n=1 Tax=Megaselia scalaris TaxID=36166 RepID=T1GTW8_MEGSC
MAVVKIVLLLVAIVAFSGCDEEDDFKYALPEDFGMPRCYAINEPCKPEDWKKSEKHIKNYIEEMVKQFLKEEVKVPKCKATNDCPKWVLDKYYKDRNDKEIEIRKKIREVNELKDD